MSSRQKGKQWWLLVLPGNSPLSLLQGIMVTNRMLLSDIDDSKKSVWQDFNIPGYDFSPFDHVRNEDTRISFSVPFINKTPKQGNVLDLYGAEKTRTASVDLSLTTEAQWRKNPICFYSGWGTHRPPLPVVVEDCKFRHKSEFVNQGIPQYTEVSFVLRYIEKSTFYQAYLKLREAGAAIGATQQASRRGLPF